MCFVIKVAATGLQRIKSVQTSENDPDASVRTMKAP